MSARPPRGLELAVIDIGYIVAEEVEDYPGSHGEAALPGVNAMIYFDRDTEQFEVWISVCGIQTKYAGNTDTPELRKLVRHLIESSEDEPGEPPYCPDPDALDARRQNDFERWLDRNG